MAPATSFAFGILLLLILKGNGEYCNISSIKLEIYNTGSKVGSDPVFEVTVKNTCRCRVMKLFLRSEGFASSMQVDPKLFRREGDDYVVNDGKAIQSSESVKFLYSWDRAFQMSPAALWPSC
ncbi:hypothetical protein M5K25_011420 [Dendrobium thyrsiflorum]|uniref:Uncharacterized protein n=1 Tax=Dendrobium thyrsiflorum TaxID=117978 RepID=A0ABD0V9N3_DENTH